MKPLKLRTRLTLWYCVVVAAVFAVFAAVVTAQQQRIGMRRVDAGLDSFTATLASLLADELSETGRPADAAHEVQTTIRDTGRHVAISLEDGTLLTSDPLNGLFADAGRAFQRPGIAWAGLAVDGQGAPGQTHGPATLTHIDTIGDWRVAARRQALSGQGYVLLSAVPLFDAMRERREAIEALATAVPLLILLAGAGGWWVATAGLRPVTRMAYAASRLPVEGSEDLGSTGTDDEVGQLRGAFNDLLHRLRRALNAQRQFMADASHELRTPLSVIRSTVDVTIAREDRSITEYRDALETIGAEIVQAGRLVDDMMMLARADAGGYPVRCDSLYLDELVEECHATLRALACERGVSLARQIEGEFPYVGDEELLRRLLLNVLRNAVQHTRRDGRVVTRVRRERSDGDAVRSGAIHIEISDEGPGIDPGDRERIFDRFVQIDSSRRHDGAGLGLPIARWIADTHGGRLDLARSSPSGSTFVVTLPGDSGGGRVAVT
jgi:signal transduction histidine kinase